MGSQPGWSFDYVPTPAQWNLWFQNKQDELNLGLPAIQALRGGLNTSGGFMGFSQAAIAAALGYTPAQLGAVNSYSSSVTAAAADANGLVLMNGASANTYTIPTNNAVPFSVGTQIRVVQLGPGPTTIAAAGGVLIFCPVGNLGIPVQFEMALLIQLSANVWLCIQQMVIQSGTFSLATSPAIQTFLPIQTLRSTSTVKWWPAGAALVAGQAAANMIPQISPLPLVPGSGVTFNHPTTASTLTYVWEANI